MILPSGESIFIRVLLNSMLTYGSVLNKTDEYETICFKCHSKMNKDYFKGIRKTWDALILLCSSNVAITYLMCWIPTLYMIFSVIYQQTSLTSYVFLTGPLGGLFGFTCIVSITSSVAIRYEYLNLLYLNSWVYSALSSWASINISIILFYFTYILPSQITWFLFLSMLPAIIIWSFSSAVMKTYSSILSLEIEKRNSTEPVIVSSIP